MNESGDRYLNRESTWLEYNQRFLDLADQEDVPALERLRSLALVSLHLDEFFMVRVAGLNQQVTRGEDCPDLSGLRPEELLRSICQRTHQMVEDQYSSFNRIETVLSQSGVRRLGAEALNARQIRQASQIFQSEIATVLTPLAVDVHKPLPRIPNQALAVCLRLRDGSKDHSAVIPFPHSVQRILTLSSDSGYAYLLLEDAVALFADQLVPGLELIECVAFRITCPADKATLHDLAGDLTNGSDRLGNDPGRTGGVKPDQANDGCVRLELCGQASDETADFLIRATGVTEEQTFRVPGPLDLAEFSHLHPLAGFEKLRYDAWPPCPSPAADLSNKLFDTLRRGDLLLHHPYESFAPVVRLLEDAADDPDVIAIKQTLYGTDRDSPIVDALVRAAENDKYVTAIVELKPRFREIHKRGWVRDLERSAVQVVHGMPGLKTHAKLCIIVRREPEGVQRYVHFGTGDYSEVTARHYSDVSLLTRDEELGRDAIDLFNSVASQAYERSFRKISAAPMGLRRRLLDLIQTEIRHAIDHQPAAITAKLNALGDPEIINALYHASQKGVRIRLMVCGLCCLRPGVTGLSENIQVISTVDRFQEHARIFHFRHGGDQRTFISSADWMPRNLDRRVELMVPVEDGQIRQRLMRILETYFSDNTRSAQLSVDGTYEPLTVGAKQAGFRSQAALYEMAVQSVKQTERSRRTHFEPHRAPEKRR